MLASHTTATAASDLVAPLPNFSSAWEEIIGPVLPFLGEVSSRLTAQVEQFEPELVELARYALSSQGKQIRPALLGLSAEATGGLHQDHVTAAVIIEMVHLATLVHDDVMDAADMRRRRPTLAARCGAPVSVLLGDCLFAHALTLAAGFPTPDVCRAVASATKTVCTGEIIQTERTRQFDLDREDYFRVLRMKTAELFALSCELGASLGGADGEDRDALRRYGVALGTAYQIYDDCVDVFGSESTAGKSLGTDLLGGKLTLPVIVALERAAPAGARALQAMLERWEPELHAELLGILRRAGALEECTQVIRGFCRDAAEALEALPPTAGRKALMTATLFLGQQTDALGAKTAP